MSPEFLTKKAAVELSLPEPFTTNFAEGEESPTEEFPDFKTTRPVLLIIKLSAVIVPVNIGFDILDFKLKLSFNVVLER